MNNVDKQYIDLVNNILENGVEKNTRAGKVKSIFGAQLRFDLKKGFPLITTKKVFTKGIIYELLWFLKGETNIKYLIDNNVNIWTDDAYRYYLEHLKKWKNNKNIFIIDANTREFFYIETLPSTKEEFITFVKNETLLHISVKNKTWITNPIGYYRFGDLGDVYGKQWRAGGENEVDQIENIIHTLKTNPDDRRMILSAWNVDSLDNVALPPCHIMAQFYTKEISNKENIPTRELSCMFFCRSQDVPLGTPYNIASYALLTHMIAQVCNMSVGDLIYNGGDCHIYLNQMDGINEQLKNESFDALPTLVLNPNITNINDFTFDDIKIEGYQSHNAIKIPLSVGL